MSDNDIKSWVNKRKFLKGRITNIENSLGNVESITNISDLELALDRLNDIFKTFEDIEINLESIDEAKYKTENLTIESKYFELARKIRKAIQILNDKRRSTELNESFLRADTRSPALPKINLPSFSGDYNDWLNFKDLFLNLIHNNTDLPDIRKFFYLKGALKKNAASVIANIDCSDDNYKKAWDAVLARYDNKVLIANNHLQGIFELQKIKSSGNSLRVLVDEFSQHLDSLNSLGIENLLDTVLVYLLSQKLDFETLREFQLDQKDNEFPTIIDFLKHLNKRCQAWEMLSHTASNNNSFTKPKKTVACTTTDSQRSAIICTLCNKPHLLMRCFQYLKWDTTRRRKFVENKKLCFNCLSSTHSVEKCSQSVCKRCSNKHHWSLHSHKNNYDNSHQVVETPPIAGPSHDVGQSQMNASASLTSNNIDLNENSKLILLATAVVNVRDVHGKNWQCRALLDSASERNFITAELAMKLKVPIQNSNWLVSGVGCRTSNVSSTVSLKVESRVSDYYFQATFGILEVITDELPKRSFGKRLIQWPSFVKLADPGFNMSDKIDMLIGSSIFYDILHKGKIDLGLDNPILQNTRLGWILGGSVNLKGEANSTTCSNVTSLNTTISDLNTTLTKFWNVEEYGSKPIRSSNEKLAEKLFVESVSRDLSGRYEVELPIIQDRIKSLGDSYNYAYRCFLSLERKFAKKPLFFTEYKSFIHELLTLGHAHEVFRFPNKYKGIEYYMPHHAVMKESSSTTKLRVVFNGSAPSSTGVSLNDILLVGPVVQPDLMAILLRFRTFLIAIITDIAKMYRQVTVKEKYQSLQRILWRDSTDEKMRCLQLNRVIYGTASASFLATRCLLQLSQDEGANFPLAARAIENNCYIDDVMSGASNLEMALCLQKELVELLGKGKFELHKWFSNDPQVLNTIDEDKREKCSYQFSDGDSTIKTLGLVWNPYADIFQISVPDEISNGINTKREILSCIAKLFDPLGLIAPVVVSAKIIMQQIWRVKLNWDDVVPDEISQTWITLSKDFQELKHLPIPRLILNANSSRYELHGFADSSTKAYGCAIYLVSFDNYNKGMSRLVCSKSRVAPIKPVTLPRLELCACVLLARFMKTVQNALALSLTISKTSFWTDSMIALAWIQSDASRWNVFVANRVSDIQDLCAKDDWNHVGSTDNPADIVSRGLNPHMLKNSALWWNGPSWLLSCQNTRPNIQITNFDLTNVPEARYISCVAKINQQRQVQFHDLFEKFSSFIPLQRIVALLIRFIHNSKIINRKFRRIGFLSCTELRESFLVISRVMQAEYFSRELEALKSQNPDIISSACFKSSKLKYLNPFLDTQQIIRVGGRLKNSHQFPEGRKFPIVLPDACHVTKLLIKLEHERLFHAGPQLTLSSLRQRVWIINGRNAVRKVIHNCLRCFRFHAKAAEQIMSDLPSIRVTPARPFLHVGLDYGGPINVKQFRIRKPLITKGYICLFICMVTKAIHLELASDMSTKTFLNALDRFIARRGKCKKLFSDNGTNFHGANNQLKGLYRLLNCQTSVSLINDSMTKQGVEWNFIPPYAPHWGGLWESGIKMIKYHLKRMIGDTSLTFEELSTTLCQIESIVNSRPLCALSNDPNDYECLTPAHFLINDTLTSLPEDNVIDIPLNRLSFWNQIRNIRQQFWKRWNIEYLSSLQERSKWLYERPDIKVGILVLIKEDNVPPLHWCLGRVIEVIEGRDGHVRAVSIKVKNGNLYVRPISKICPLPDN